MTEILPIRRRIKSPCRVNVPTSLMDNAKIQGIKFLNVIVIRWKKRSQWHYFFIDCLSILYIYFLCFLNQTKVNFSEYERLFGPHGILEKQHLTTYVPTRWSRKVTIWYSSCERGLAFPYEHTWTPLSQDQKSMGHNAYPRNSSDQ